MNWPDGGRGGFEQRGFGGDADGFGEVAELERQVDVQHFGGFDLDAFALKLFEAGGGGGEGIAAGVEERQDVDAGLIGLDAGGHAGGLIGGDDFRAGDDGGSGIQNAAADAALGRLCKRGESGKPGQSGGQKDGTA